MDADVRVRRQAEGVARLPRQLHAAIETASGKLKIYRPRLRAVFDVDGTLFFNEARTAALIEVFAAMIYECVKIERAHVIIEAIRLRLQSGQMVYDPKANWLAVAFADEPELAETWISYWTNAFFQNDVLHHDVPAPGAPEFLRMIRGLLGRTSLQILTGRHDASSDPQARYPHGMRLGTEAALWRHGFPAAELICKRFWTDPDIEFKRGHFDAMLGRTPDPDLPLVFMDNEPAVLDMYDRMMRDAGLPHVSILLDSPHVTQADLHPDIIVLSAFPNPQTAKGKG